MILIGGGGHARAVADVIQAQRYFQIVGLIDSFQSKGVKCFGYPVLGGEADLPEICTAQGVARFGLAIGDNFQREAIAQRIGRAIPNAEFASLVHPSAVLGNDVGIGAGTVVMPGVIIMAGCRIGEGCVLNTGCSLDHDGQLDAWSSLGPGAIVGGSVRVGRRSFIGLGARVIQKVSVGRDTVVGAGAVVLSDLPDGVLAYGLPCKPIRERRRDEAHL